MNDRLLIGLITVLRPRDVVRFWRAMRGRHVRALEASETPIIDFIKWLLEWLNENRDFIEFLIGLFRSGANRKEVGDALFAFLQEPADEGV